MSERHTHQATAVVNVALAKRLEKAGGDCLCWVPTMIFYAAVQIAESRFADDSLHVTQHPERHGYVRHYSSDVTGPTGYKNLKTLSEEWRYEGKVPRPDQIPAAWRWAENIATAMGEPWPPT